MLSKEWIKPQLIYISVQQTNAKGASGVLDSCTPSYDNDPNTTPITCS
jgi:hypothetical protein